VRSGPAEPPADSEDVYTVVVCEDSRELGALVAARLDEHPALSVLAVAHDAGSAVRAVAGADPDVVLLDLLLPGSRPDDLVDAIAGAAPDAAIVLFSGVPDPLGALGDAAGKVALGIDKTVALDELARRVARVAAGRR
jgi:DNA-binding NarL/FixJ family response regulator